MEGGVRAEPEGAERQSDQVHVFQKISQHVSEEKLLHGFRRASPKPDYKYLLLCLN